MKTHAHDQNIFENLMLSEGFIHVYRYLMR